MKRDELLRFVNSVAKYQVRWFSQDLNGRTIEVLDVPKTEEQNIVQRLRPFQKSLDKTLNGPVILIFQTSSSELATS